MSRELVSLLWIDYVRRRLGDDVAEHRAAEIEMSQIITRPIRWTGERSCTRLGVRLGAPKPMIPVSA